MSGARRRADGARAAVTSALTVAAVLLMGPGIGSAADDAVQERSDRCARADSAAAADRPDDRRTAGPTSGAEAREQAASLPPRELMERARRRYERLNSLTARFEQTVAVPLLDRESHGEGRWYQKGPGRFKMEFTDPPEDVIVADGEDLWLYYPSTHPGQVIRTEIEASSTGRGMADLQGRIFQEARRGYRIEDGGTGGVSGTPVRELVLTPTEGSASPYRKVRIWIGREDLLVRRFEITEENETVRTVRLRDLQPDVPVPDSVFRFRVPKGVEVFSG